ncbi:hypothetical protein FAZ95_28655 [Trinickia violacea]|uniref:DUF2783 domain-containing protein n=1 Tax=Trinickia violacea TaxID=2571746 RepID=A0A4P8IYK3_9BURK|nr:hypothetical protein [Trinickia violacea]QCP53065.1 hypothetical protein FAZ95_28655 [Trinickia violacea]
MMNASELDAVYTALCKTMTRIGEPDATLFLARFALLAIDALDDAHKAMSLIDAACDEMPVCAQA